MLIPTKAMVSAAAATLLLLVTHAVSFGQVESSSEVQTWLDDTLQHKIEAKYKGMEGDFVKLETADGSIKKIPYSKLSLSSQLKAKKYSDPKSLEGPPLPSSFSAPPVSESPFSPDDTIEKHLETEFKMLSEGHADVAWHVLPPSAKADLEGGIIRLAEILGPNTFKQIQAILPSLHTIVKDKRSFIVGTPAIAAQPELAKVLNQALPAMEPLVATLTKPSVWNSENFKEGKVGPWFMLFANDALSASKSLRPMLKQLAPSIETDYANVKYKVLEKTADTAKVELSAANGKQIMVYKKVDGCWLADADATLAGLSAFRSRLESLDQAGRDELKSRTKMVLTLAGGALGGLSKARTQQEFSQLFDPYAAQGVRLYMQAAAAGRQTGQGTGQQAGNNSGGSGLPRKSIADGLSGVGSQSQ